MRRTVLWVAAIFVICGWCAARAQNTPSASGGAPGDLALIVPGGIQAAVRDLVPIFQEKTGLKVQLTSATGGVTKDRVASGGAFDVSVMEKPYDTVITSGNVAADSVIPVATTTLSVVVKQGAPKPDISTDAALKKALLDAPSVAYPDATTGAGAGVEVEEVLDKLGIKDQVKAKAKYAVAMGLVAEGQAEIGISFRSQEMMPGLDVLGPVPADLIAPTIYFGFVSSHPRDAAKAKQLLAFLASPEAAKAYEAHGLELAPATK